MRVDNVQSHTAFRADLKIVGDVSKELKGYFTSRAQNIGDITDTIILSLGKPETKTGYFHPFSYSERYNFKEESRVIKVTTNLKNKNVHEHKDLSYKNMAGISTDSLLIYRFDKYLNTLV